jgi:hypothetical protein
LSSRDARPLPGRAVAAQLSPRTVRPDPTKRSTSTLAHDQARAGYEFPSEGVADSGNPFTFVFDVLELAVDAAIDVVRGRRVWRHPARLQRVRHDLHPDDLSAVAQDPGPRARKDASADAGAENGRAARTHGQDAFGVADIGNAVNASTSARAPSRWTAERAPDQHGQGPSRMFG